MKKVYVVCAPVTYEVTVLASSEEEAQEMFEDALVTNPDRGQFSSDYDEANIQFHEVTKEEMVSTLVEAHIHRIALGGTHEEYLADVIRNGLRFPPVSMMSDDKLKKQYLKHCYDDGEEEEE